MTTLTIDWNHELIDLLEWHWDNLFRPRIDDLTDDEYLWEPVAGCWSLRPRDEAASPMAAGAGGTVADFEMPEPDPPPVTTIAWRLGHVSIGVLGMRAANHFGASVGLDQPIDYATTDWPLTARGGLDLLDRHYRAWTAGLRSLDADGLARPCGPAEGPYADHPFAALVLHITREVIHHGAEVLLLRDLYRNRDHWTGSTRAAA